MMSGSSAISLALTYYRGDARVMLTLCVLGNPQACELEKFLVLRPLGINLVAGQL